MLVLETDEVHPDTEQQRGSFGDVFNQLFTTAGRNYDPSLEIEADMRYVVEADGGKIPEVKDSEGVRAVLITGSMYDAHGNYEWILKLLKALKGVFSSVSSGEMIARADWVEIWQTRPDICFSDICFGDQFLCRLLGSKVEPVPSGKWELA